MKSTRKEVPANLGTMPKPKGKVAFPGGGGRNAEGSSTGGPIKSQTAVNDPTRPANGRGRYEGGKGRVKR